MIIGHNSTPKFAPSSHYNHGATLPVTSWVRDVWMALVGRLTVFVHVMYTVGSCSLSPDLLPESSLSVWFLSETDHRVVLQFSIIKHIAAVVHDLQRCFLQRFHAVVLGDRNDIRSTKICVTYHSVSWFPGRMS